MKKVKRDNYNLLYIQFIIKNKLNRTKIRINYK